MPPSGRGRGEDFNRRAPALSGGDDCVHLRHESVVVLGGLNFAPLPVEAAMRSGVSRKSTVLEHGLSTGVDP
jgi:hypothetical protein